MKPILNDAFRYTNNSRGSSRSQFKKKMHNTMDTNSVKKGFALLKRNPILVIIVAFKRMNNSIHYIRLGENVGISHFEAD